MVSFLLLILPSTIKTKRRQACAELFFIHWASFPRKHHSGAELCQRKSWGGTGRAVLWEIWFIPLGSALQTPLARVLFPHVTCVTLRDCFPPFPRQFYLQSLSTLYPLIFSRCFLGNSWEFLNLRDLRVLRADVHTGSLNHSFNIWKNTTSTLLFHSKH